MPPGELPDFFVYYMTAWGLACLLAVVLMVRLRRELDLFRREYWTGLLQRWKWISFAVAAAGMVVIAPHTGDPTWDYFDAAFMSVLAYATAPWAVASIYLVVRGRRPPVHAYVAACVWMFSASWSYDLYLVLRDGAYPLTWFPNIFASSALYLCAGFMWSLEYVEGRGVIFGFMDQRWPAVPVSGNVMRMAWYVLPFMIMVTAMIVPFLF